MISGNERGAVQKVIRNFSYFQEEVQSYGFTAPQIMKDVHALLGENNVSGIYYDQAGR